LILSVVCLAVKAECPQFEVGLQVGTVANDLLSEISGIAASRKNTDVFWVHNDRGNQARVWALTSEGTHLGIYYLSGATNRDWEDIAIGPGPVDGVDYLYVGNIGGGGAPNPYITVYRVAEPMVDSQQPPVETTLTDVDTINLEYPDGDQYRDAETLMLDPVTKDIYIISKEDYPPRVYRAPYPQSTTATITMEHVCNLPYPWDETSGGDISLDGSMIIVRDDDDHASIWLRPEGTNLWEAFSGTECSVELPFPSEVNGEAICFDADGKGYYTTTEREGGPKPPIYYFAPLQANFPVTIYVDADATGANDGTNWADAFNYLQDALSDAKYGDEIRVAEGIYKPDEDTDNPTGTGDREATFQLKKGVTIKGGYAGFGEPDPNIRDIQKYETILSGDLDGNDVAVNDPCDLLTEATRSENSYHVVTNINIDETAVLDGFSITAGNANGSFGDYTGVGGGMFNNGHDYLCNPKVICCTFFCNSAVEFGGGGMFNYEHGDGECKPIITDCRFIKNASATLGGGLCNWESSPEMTNCIFLGNFGDGGGGGMGNSGFGPPEGSSPTLINCIFIGNSTEYMGGGIHNSEYSSPLLVNCSFSSNSAANEAGGIYNRFYSNPTLTNCILWGNTDGGPTDESAQICNYISSIPVINYCCVQGWSGTLGGISNIGDDPMFVDADGPDNVVGTEDDNLRLMEGSPCIDNGNNAAIPVEVDTDLDGHPRIIDGDCDDNGIVDMGTYEFNYAYMGDFDYNCKVDFGDFAIFALAWLTGPEDAQWNPACDIGIPNDSSINMPDLHVFVENWLAGIE